MTEQERFEVWFASDVDCRISLSVQPNALKFEDGEYGNSFLANSAWKAWQAATAPRAPEGYVLVPVEPSNAMLVAARDWSVKKYGQAVGNDGASGCYKAMIKAVKENEDEV